jgi:hypothetical protein
LHESLNVGGLRRPEFSERVLDPQRQYPQVEADDQGEDGVDDDQEDGRFQPAAAVGRQGRQRTSEGDKSEDTVADASYEEEKRDIRVS